MLDALSVSLRELVDSASAWVGQLVDYLPSLVGALLLLLAGWLIAHLLRVATTRLSTGYNNLSVRIAGHRVGGRLRMSPRGTSVVGRIVYWVVVLLFVTAAAQVLGLGQFVLVLEQIVAYLPTLLAGALIIGIGVLVSAIARDFVASLIAPADAARAAWAGRLAQGATLLIAVVIGIDQIGIDVTLLVAVIAIVLGTFLSGLALAFALGARPFISNVIGIHYMRQRLQPAQSVRIGDTEGTIEEFTPVSVVVAARDGRVVIPGSVFHEATIRLIEPRGGDA